MKINVEFKPLTDFEKLAYSNLYVIELKKKIHILAKELIEKDKIIKGSRKLSRKINKINEREKDSIILLLESEIISLKRGIRKKDRMLSKLINRK